MSKNTFYGSSELNAVSYLEFGSIDIKNGKKNIWDFRLHEKSYDWLMLARYSNDLVAYINMLDKLKKNKIDDVFSIYNSEVHHNDDAAINLSKLIALEATKKSHNNSSFFELGQTIYGCIEGMLFYKELLKKMQIFFLEIDLQKIDWYGVDISSFFNTLACIMHEKYKVNTMLHFEKNNNIYDVFFAKGVTLLYACDTVADFVDIINKGKLGIFDYSFALGKEQEEIIGTGKTVKYHSYEECNKLLKKTNKKIFIKIGNSKIDNVKNRAWVDCIIGEESICRNFIELDVKLRKKIANKISGLNGSERFLNNDVNPEWVAIQTFIEEYL